MQNYPAIVRANQLREVVGVPSSTGWAWAKDPGNSFPAPRKFGNNFTGWLLADLLEWVNTRDAVYEKDDC